MKIYSSTWSFWGKKCHKIFQNETIVCLRVKPGDFSTDCGMARLSLKWFRSILISPSIILDEVTYLELDFLFVIESLFLFFFIPFLISYDLSRD